MPIDALRADLAHLRHVVYGMLPGLGVLALGVLIGGVYLGQQQAQSLLRVEKQRAAICAILQNIPGRIPPEIAHARIAFARPGHPADCQPITRRPIRPSAVTPAPASTPVVLIPAVTVTRPARPKPATTSTASPRPTPRRSPSRSLSPSPSPTCVHVVATVCT